MDNRYLTLCHADKVASLVIRFHFHDNPPMAKWIWLALFVITVAVIAWLGTRQPSENPTPKAAPSTLSAPSDESVESEVPVVPQVPMNPQQITPPAPTPYTDVQPQFNDTPRPEGSPVYEGVPNDPLDNNYPPPPQAYPPDMNNSQVPFGDAEAMPQYLQPTPGLDDEGMDILPPPEEE